VGHVEIRFQVAHHAGEFLGSGDAIFGLLAFLKSLLRLLLVLPEVRLADFRFEAGQARAVFGDVKDSSARAPRGASARRSDAADLR
jgi:hypothetical protein